MPSTEQEDKPKVNYKKIRAFREILPTDYHPCSKCDLQFISAPLLANHMKSHVPKPLHYCPHCDVVTTDAPKLKRHMITHTGEKPFECDICHKKFGLEYNMKIHRRIHSGERPYKCTVCNKSFAQSSNLKLHMQNHKGIHNVGAVNASQLGLGSAVPPSERSPALNSYYKKKLETYRR